MKYSKIFLIFGFLMVSLNMFSQTKNTYIYHDAEIHSLNSDYKSENDSCANLKIISNFGPIKVSVAYENIKKNTITSNGEIVFTLDDGEYPCVDSCAFKNSFFMTTSSSVLIPDPEETINNYSIPLNTKTIRISCKNYKPITIVFPNKIKPKNQYQIMLSSYYWPHVDSSQATAIIIFKSNYETQQSLLLNYHDGIQLRLNSNDETFGYIINHDGQNITLFDEIKVITKSGKYVISLSNQTDYYKWFKEIEIKPGDQIEISNKFEVVKLPSVEQYLTKYHEFLPFQQFKKFEFRTAVLKRNGSIISKSRLMPRTNVTIYSMIPVFSVLNTSATQYRGYYEHAYNYLNYAHYIKTRENTFYEFPLMYENIGGGSSFFPKLTLVQGFLPKVLWDVKNNYSIWHLLNLGYHQSLINKYSIKSDINFVGYLACYSNVYNHKNKNQQLEDQTKHFIDLTGLSLSFNNSFKIWSHYNLEVKAGYELLKSSIDNAKWYDKTAPEGQQYSDVDFSKLKVYHKSSPFVSIGIAF